VLTVAASSFVASSFPIRSPMFAGSIPILFSSFAARRAFSASSIMA
jgi:hypothetical protein